VAVGRTLRAGKVKPGTVFLLKTTQRVPVSEDAYLDRGAAVRGEVVTSEAGDRTAAHPATLAIRFTQLSYRGMMVPLVTRAVAMANLMDVDGTFLPLMGGADRGNSSEGSWTTMQVGGEEVVRSGWIGPVVGSGLRTVGRADYYGVYGLPEKAVGDRWCDGSAGDGCLLDDCQGALWVRRRNSAGVVGWVDYDYKSDGRCGDPGWGSFVA
jgi:hypothetical protein